MIANRVPAGGQEHQATEVIDKRISKLIGHHIRDVNAELYQELIKAGLALDETSADFGEFAWRLYNAATNGIADVRMQIT